MFEKTDYRNDFLSNPNYTKDAEPLIQKWRNEKKEENVTNGRTTVERSLLEDLQKFSSTLQCYHELNVLRAQEDDFYDIKILIQELLTELNSLDNHIDEHTS